MIKALRTVGRYLILMGRVFTIPERWRMFFRQYIKEVEQLGVDSIGIVLLISFFIGAVITIQFKLNIESVFMPRWTVGYATREIMLLEFSSAIMCLILAGKVGSNIASELGTMRVTQQIDALEIMGVNSAGYLILPKISAFVEWFVWSSFIKSLCFGFIISSVASFFGYTVEGGSISVGKASTNAVVTSSVLILFADLMLTKILA